MQTLSRHDPHTIRVLVVGESRVGKTLLIRRLCHDMNDDIHAAWGPTIGFDVDVLVRDTVLPNPIASVASNDLAGDVMNSPFTPSGNAPYQRRASSSYAPGTLYDAADSSFLQQSPNNRYGHTQSSASVTQTVELHELGGTRSFGTECHLPLQLIQYDGIMFVYDRADTGSTTYLSKWYSEMKSLFSSNINNNNNNGCSSTATEMDANGAGSSSNGNASQPRMPKIMLVGTQVTPTSLGFLHQSKHSNSSGDGGGASAYLPDEMLVDPATLLEAQRQKMHDSRKRPRGLSQRTIWSIIGILKMFFWILCSPSILLSEQYQEERSTRLTCLSNLLTMWARAARFIERTILFCMAVVLFGFHQELVMFTEPTVRGTLNQIREDPLCVAQAHTCYLYDRFAFESSTDQLHHFFDVLHADKVAASVGTY